jgi:hypothetical protein
MELILRWGNIAESSPPIGDEDASRFIGGEGMITKDVKCSKGTAE